MIPQIQHDTYNRNIQTVLLLIIMTRILKVNVKYLYPGVYPNEYFASPDLLPWAEPAMSIGGRSVEKY